MKYILKMAFKNIFEEDYYTVGIIIGNTNFNVVYVLDREKLLQNLMHLLVRSEHHTRWKDPVLSN